MHSEMHRRQKEIWDSTDRETTDYLISRILSDYSRQQIFCDWLEENIEDCLAVFELPPGHRRRLRTTNGVERMNEEIRRRTIPVRIFPNRESALRLLTALLQDIHEEWVTGRRYLNMELIEEWEEERETGSEAEPVEGLGENHRKLRKCTSVPS